MFIVQCSLLNDSSYSIAYIPIETASLYSSVFKLLMNKS